MAEQSSSEARELYFQYDGSLFYMSRDGVDARYRSYAVPADVEKEWLVELTAAKLHALEKPGNWAVVHFLWHHNDTRHLSRLLQTEPLGVPWQCCAYLEELLTYVQLCVPGLADDEFRAAVQCVLSRAHGLEQAVQEQKLRTRVRSIIDSAEASLP